MSVEMTFQHQGWHTGLADAGKATALAIEVAAGDKSVWTADFPMQVERVGVQVVVAVDYNVVTTLCQVSFDRRVTFGSDTGRVEMGRVTIPNGAPAGAVYWIDIPVADGKDHGRVNTGGQVVSEVAVAGTGGGAIAGDFHPVISWQPRGEAIANDLSGTGVAMSIRDTTTVQV